MDKESEYFGDRYGGFSLSDLSIFLDDFKIRSMGLGCEDGFLSYGLTVLAREWGALEARVDSAPTPIGCRIVPLIEVHWGWLPLIKV